MIKNYANYALAATIEAHNELQRCEKSLDARRRWLREAEKSECSESFIETRRKSVEVGEACVRAAKKSYGDRAREVRCFNADGSFKGIQTDKSRSINDWDFESNYDADYEREAEAVAAALYENGCLDF